jgi:ribonucleoside-triphosphate reductase
MKFKLTDSFLEKYKKTKPPFGFNGLGEIVYKRTYSRIKENGEKEEWYETVERCINGAQRIGAGYSKEEAEELFDLIFNLKCNFPGRMLWQLGTPTVDKYGGNSLLNCWFTTINEPKCFEFIFENLMLGGGVGYSVKREHINELPKICKNVNIINQNTKDADLIVADSRQGWVRLLHYVLKSFFENGKSFSYSTILVRGSGEKINGFGGTASGPQILIDGITKIINVFKEREGKKLRSLDVLDICNIIGSVVVAGNVRRSAQISLGDPDDYLFLRAKRWDLGNVPNWRAMSNNTIYADDFSHISDSIWDGYQGNGEPYGFFNLPLSQKYGRLGELKNDNCEGLNPCGEITLSNFECCNLAELYLNNITSKEELIKCAKLLYKTQKAVSALNFIHEETNAIVHKNMRLGLGITGVCQSLEKIEWLDDCYNALKKFDKEWSKQNNWSESIKLTTIKPSGTVSILAGATPGIHPAFSKYYIRRIRMSSGDSLAQQCRESGYKVEYAKNFDNSENRDTVVIEFPCESSEGAVLSKDMTAIRQLELVKKLQTVWADNAISVTVYYRKEELDGIKKWLKENYKTSLKSVSFLLHSEHGFKQAPYSEINKEEYEFLVKKIQPLKLSVGSLKEEVIDTGECAGGVCPIR